MENNRFGLVALMSLSLFASTTAFAVNPPPPTQVVVTNTPAQPVPVVGLIKDSDAAARKPFQWEGTLTQPAHVDSAIKLTTVPPTQRLVIEQVSGMCDSGGILYLEQSVPVHHYQFLPASFANSAGAPVSTPIRFYADPTADFSMHISNPFDLDLDCTLSVTGYFVNLP
jgi:hypothetical protein